MSKLTDILAGRRLIMLGAAGALLVVFLQFPEPQAAPSQPRPPLRQAEVQPVMPKGYNPSAVIRDPFAVPPEFRPAAPAAPAGGAAQPGRQPAAQELRPVVLGIVGAGNTRAAIIQIGAESRSYRVNERAGSYLITAINSSSVVLEGPGGRLIAPLER